MTLDFTDFSYMNLRFKKYLNLNLNSSKYCDTKIKRNDLIFTLNGWQSIWVKLVLKITNAQN